MAKVRIFDAEGQHRTLEIIDADAFEQGDILYYDATKKTFVRLAKGTAGQTLKMNAGATAPEWVT